VRAHDQIATLQLLSSGSNFFAGGFLVFFLSDPLQFALPHHTTLILNRPAHALARTTGPRCTTVPRVCRAPASCSLNSLRLLIAAVAEPQPVVTLQNDECFQVVLQRRARGRRDLWSEWLGLQDVGLAGDGVPEDRLCGGRALPLSRHNIH
jgi:hypothetical protein